VCSEDLYEDALLDDVVMMRIKNSNSNVRMRSIYLSYSPLRNSQTFHQIITSDVNTARLSHRIASSLSTPMTSTENLKPGKTLTLPRVRRKMTQSSCVPGCHYSSRPPHVAVNDKAWITDFTSRSIFSPEPHGRDARLCFVWNLMVKKRCGKA
jgi:hypothetical protein